MPDNNIIEKDLGPVSAWAIAKANGFDGTEAEWEALQANAAQNGSDAEAFAKGTRNGEAVASDDPAYHNNCAYHHAGTSADADTCTTKAAEATAAAATASAAYNVNLLAPNYSAESTYAVGDHVIYNGGYYECISAISTAEAWTAAHWRQLTVGGESADLKSAFNTRSRFTFQSVGEYTVSVDDIVTGSSSSDMFVCNPGLTNRIRVQSPIHINPGDQIILTLGTNCDYVFYTKYAEDGTVYPNDIRIYNGTTTFDFSGYIVLVLRRTGNGDLQPSDYDAQIKISPEFVRLANTLDFDYPISAEYTYHKVASKATKAWYSTDSLGAGSAIISASGVQNLHIVSGYATSNVPIVVFLSSDTPSSFTWIGNYGTGSSSSTPELIQNIDCPIPTGCTHIVIQGYYAIESEKPVVTKKTTITEYIDINDDRVEDIEEQISKRISYSLNGTNLTMRFKYGSKTGTIEFGKRGPNNLPDFKNILSGSDFLYGGTTDWFAPYIVAAKSNINGDDTSHQYFTGGNHNYNNSGDSSGSATGRNTSLLYYADGKLLSDGDNGECEKIRIEWINRVQGYNTRKSDGTGREILEEKHILEFDGVSACVTTDIMPLENVTVETWYGYQANITNWDTIEYIGGVNREAIALSSHPSSGNKTPNVAHCYSSTDVLEIEIDRTFDLGKSEFYNGTAGMFTSGSKVYCYIIENSDLAEDNHYCLRGWYRFMPCDVN